MHLGFLEYYSLDIGATRGNVQSLLAPLTLPREAVTNVIICPRSLAHLHIATHCTKMDKASCTYSKDFKECEIQLKELCNFRRNKNYLYSATNNL